MVGLKPFFTSSLLASGLFSTAFASPSASTSAVENVDRRSSTWWMADIARNGTVAYADNVSGYTIFRNVLDYGATGDGTTDDTAAINSAMSDQGRCGEGCNSSTTTPAIVYFPPGTYLVSSPIIQYYYTQMIGDLNDVPTLKASADFSGIAVVDSDPYESNGANWWVNQNNFFRQVRNFIIDVTAQPATTGTCIHWQVAQATSLQNIVFNMRTDSGNAQQGIFMDNGSGGYMSNLTFNGGKYGAFLGNQQFTVRDIYFNNCQTGLYINWGWVWTFAGLTFDNCGVGLDMTAGGSVQSAGSVIVMDSTFSNTPVGVTTTFTTSQSGTNGTLILSNVDMSNNVPVAVQDPSTSDDIVTGNQNIAYYVQGRVYDGADGGKPVQGTESAPTRPAALTSGGAIVTKNKPQYADVPASQFVSVKAAGAAGDGTTDDTAAIQAVFDNIASDEIVYFDHGAYLITDTINVPSSVKVVGEIWPLIMAGGSSSFADASNPQPVWKVGSSGDTGEIEMQDLIFETRGQQPGAILMEWNVEGSSQGAAGLFDVHFRVGGTAGTELQQNVCAKSPSTQNEATNSDCYGAFLMVHVTSSGGIYMENSWMWTADHDLDMDGNDQLTLYNGRGILIESTAGSWLWGTSCEHNVLENYSLHGAKNVFMGVIQTETPYWAGDPVPTEPFAVNTAYYDPTFSSCSSQSDCKFTWGLRVVDSSDILIYGTGLYSWYDNYNENCVDTNSCQYNMIEISNSDVDMFAVSTKAAINMITLNGASAATNSDNEGTYCGCVAAFSASSSSTSTDVAASDGTSSDAETETGTSDNSSSGNAQAQQGSSSSSSGSDSGSNAVASSSTAQLGGLSATVSAPPSSAQPKVTSPPAQGHVDWVTDFVVETITVTVE